MSSYNFVLVTSVIKYIKLIQYLGGEHLDVVVLLGRAREAVGQVVEPGIRKLHHQVLLLGRDSFIKYVFLLFLIFLKKI